VFESAVVDEIITTNPIKVAPNELPKKVDADPEWRSNATFTVAEVEQLISAPLIPVERRVQYALKALAGMRHGEIAALCWRHIDYTAEPLARINITQAYSTSEREVKSTKTEETRAVPMHPTLATIIKAWREKHWERIYGRKPTPDDFVVPTRNFTCVDGADAVHASKDDLDALGLRKKAGTRRDRGGHDLRSWYKTRLIEDEADSLIVRRTTHAPPKDVDGGYERFSWSVICREVGKLKVKILDGKPLAVLTETLQAEAKAAGRWQKAVTPLGLEGFWATNSLHDKSESSTATAKSGAHTQADASISLAGRTYSLTARMARALEAALRQGDMPRALRVLHRCVEPDD
jgi:hypothetical protein